MALVDVQEVLADAFRKFDPLSDRDDIAAIVSGNDRLTPHQQAEIYREQFWLRHRNVLRDDFPALRVYLGEDAFDEFMRAYLLACPPDSYTLRNLGNRISTFADAYEHFPADMTGPARDLARFELAFVDVFDGADEVPVSIEAVQELSPEDWPRAVLTISALLDIIPLTYPVHRIRRAVKQEQEVPAVDAEPMMIALWRSEDLKVSYRPVSDTEALDLPGKDAELAENLQSWFKGWAKRGWITAVSVA